MAATHDFVLKFKNIAPGAERDYPRALQGAHVLVVAESHKRRAYKYVDSRYWITIQGPGGGKGRVAMHLRRNRFKVLSWSNPVLNEGFGMDFPAAKRYSLVVKIMDMFTGRVYNIEGDHYVPHADMDRRPGVITLNPRRRNVRAGIASTIRRFPWSLRGQDFVVGDMNIDLDSDIRIRDNGMIEQFNRGGFRSDVQLLGAVPDTHHRMEYDWILMRLSGSWRRWTRPNGTAWLVGHGTDPKGRSDHRARWIRVRVTVKRGWRRPKAYGG